MSYLLLCVAYLTLDTAESLGSHPEPTTAPPPPTTTPECDCPPECPVCKQLAFNQQAGWDITAGQQTPNAPDALKLSTNKLDLFFGDFYCIKCTDGSDYLIKAGDLDVKGVAGARLFVFVFTINPTPVVQVLFLPLNGNTQSATFSTDSKIDYVCFNVAGSVLDWTLSEVSLQVCKEEGKASRKRRAIGDGARMDGAVDEGTFTTGTECDDLPNPANGVVNHETQEGVGKVATYGCNDGFVMEGVGCRVCQPDGNWSGVAATCEVQEGGA